ncbi:MAG: hypothetical protein LBC96_09305, partial [Lachnospiraceae bacterium]|nr:hypothetical protein [Lachnospiraceae bacterium]
MKKATIRILSVILCIMLLVNITSDFTYIYALETDLFEEPESLPEQDDVDNYEDTIENNEENGEPDDPVTENEDIDVPELPTDNNAKTDITDNDGEEQKTEDKTNEITEEEKDDDEFVLEELPFEDGSEEFPFLIDNYETLLQFTEGMRVNAMFEGVRLLTASFKLTSDLDLSGITFTPIGTSSLPFGGTFDGNGHVISNLVIDLPTIDNVGLFSHNSGVIRDLRIESSSISGRNNVGGLVGNNISGRIIGVNVDVSVRGTSAIGGLVGRSINGRIEGTSSTMDITVPGATNVGGLIGLSSSDTISLSYSTGSIIGGGQIGGLVGQLSGTTISRSYATGNISATSFSGGLVGYMLISTIRDSFSRGNVSEQHTSGG